MLLEVGWIIALRQQSEAFSQRVDLGVVPGQEQPAGRHLEFLGVRLQHFGGVVDGVDADGVEVDVTSDLVAQQFLHLAQARGFQRAGVAATGEDEIDQHHLAFDQVVIEPQTAAVVAEQVDIGEVRLAPGQGLGLLEINPAPGSRADGDQHHEQANGIRQRTHNRCFQQGAAMSCPLGLFKGRWVLHRRPYGTSAGPRSSHT
ncbi:hypothetical protein D9M70_482090 [compost metagenome]